MDASKPDPAATDGWAGERAARWAAQWESLDRQLAEVTDTLLPAAAARRGERVLDVGCGTGPTTRLVAEAVGASGSVVGLDVAAEMLEVARDVPVSDGAGPIEWVLADATTWPGTGEPFDLVLSRFGVMFFDDPDAAFANLRRLLAPTGRLCIATWQERPRSAFFEVPLSVALEHSARWGIESEVLDPVGGPFSLHESAVRELLDRTGWHDVDSHRHDLSFLVGGAATPVEAAAHSLEVGPARIVAEGLTDAQRDEVRAGVAAVYRDHVDADGFVRLDGGVVITTARP